jgi:hypothetical protein
MSACGIKATTTDLGCAFSLSTSTIGRTWHNVAFFSSRLRWLLRAAVRHGAFDCFQGKDHLHNDSYD